MDPLRKSAVLWGAIGALSFGVLYQGYAITGGAYDWRVLLAGMALIGVVIRLVSPRIERRLWALQE
jgi:hypothetical protein